MDAIISGIGLGEAGAGAGAAGASTVGAVNAVTGMSPGGQGRKDAAVAQQKNQQQSNFLEQLISANKQLAGQPRGSEMHRDLVDSSQGPNDLMKIMGFLG